MSEKTVVADKGQEVPAFEDEPDVEIKEGQQRCRKCGNWLPMTGHYWHADRSQPTGLHRECRQCRALKKQDDERVKIAKRVAQLDENSLTFLDSLVNSPVAYGVPEARAMAADLLYAYGGSAGFARHYLANFLAAEPGSAVRQKHLDRIVGLIEKLSSTGKVAIKQMGDDELREELSRRVAASGIKLIAHDDVA